MRRDTGRCGFRIPISSVWIIGIATLIPIGARAQADGLSPDPFHEVGMRPDGTFRLETLMEVTVFRIDILSLEVRLPADLRQDLVRLTETEAGPDAAGDSLARLVLGADRLWARQVMHRNVDRERLTSGILETVERAVRAGWVSEAHYQTLEEELPVLFSFLGNEGARRGDQIFFEVRGDTVRTVYRTVDGTTPMDRTASGPEVKAASIPAFFAPGTRFREGLLESLAGTTGQ